MKAIKVFISQPMRGRKTEDIISERKQAFYYLQRSHTSQDFRLIDSVLNLSEDKTPLYYLSESLKLMSEADLALFCEGWEEARGCNIEHLCAGMYGIPCVYLYDMKREIQVGAIYQHFKRELCSEEELLKDPKKYQYKVIAIAKHTEEEEDLVIYQALYGDKGVWARPKDMFLGEVDKITYPNIKQKYRFERIDI